MYCRPQNGAFLDYVNLTQAHSKPSIRAVTRELPNNYPFIVQKDYIKAFVKQWDGPAQTVFTAIVKKVKEATLRVVDIHFGNYGYSRFKQRVS
jgi:hypothetical protein